MHARAHPLIRRIEVFHSLRFLALAALPAALGVVAIALYLVGAPISGKNEQASGSSSVAQQHDTLTISPGPIMLGVVDAGELVQTAFSVRNPRSAPITLDRIETGCSCVSLSPVPIEIGPGERRTLTVTFDSSPDPEFDGDLSIEIIGYVADDTVAFRTEAKVSVLP